MAVSRILAGVVLATLLWAPAVSALPSPESTLDGVQGMKGERSIRFMGVLRDRTDLAAIRIGAAGYWFPQFDAGEVRREAPTQDGALDRLPAWVSAFNHTTGPTDPGCTDHGAVERGCMPTYYFRTFSRDSDQMGSHGGIDRWSILRLPSGECGLSGAIVDPHTFAGGSPNTNNTINRIQLQDGAPSTFYVSVLTDNTDTEHDPAAVAVRGNVGLIDVPHELADSQVEPDREPGLSADDFNGVPDIYVFKVTGFASGDYLKLRMRGLDAAASFGGLLFDTDPPGPGRSLAHSRGHGPGGGPPLGRLCRSGHPMVDSTATPVT